MGGRTDGFPFAKRKILRWHRMQQINIYFIYLTYGATEYDGVGQYSFVHFSSFQSLLSISMYNE